MSYPATPTLSVAALHVRAALVAVVVPAVRPVGVDRGGLAQVDPRPLRIGAFGTGPAGGGAAVDGLRTGVRRALDGGGRDGFPLREQDVGLGTGRGERGGQQGDRRYHRGETGE